MIWREIEGRRRLVVPLAVAVGWNLDYDGRVARLDLRVGSGTYVRAIAEALGGHCRTLRRTEVGPFLVEEADEARIVPPEEALARLG